MRVLPSRHTGWRVVAALFVCVLAASDAAAFDFEDVAREAERLARAPYRKPPAAELAYFGLIPDFIGRGLGSFLLATAIDVAWSHPMVISAAAARASQRRVCRM